jgi:hypothetical protein
VATRIKREKSSEEERLQRIEVLRTSARAEEKMATATRFLEFSANNEEWIMYKERLEQHFTANRVVDETIKVAVLL